MKRLYLCVELHIKEIFSVSKRSFQKLNSTWINKQCQLKEAWPPIFPPNKTKLIIHGLCLLNFVVHSQTSSCFKSPVMQCTKALAGICSLFIPIHRQTSGSLLCKLQQALSFPAKGGRPKVWHILLKGTQGPSNPGSLSYKRLGA